jgi:two-component system nitrogen regulation sensor histidine kinase NtrY
MPSSEPQKPKRTLSPTQRRSLLAPLAIGTVVLLGVVLAQQAFNLKMSPDSAEQTLLLVVLSALVFLLLVALTFVLLRNVFKLYADRRMGVLGSRFRTRMVIGALLLSFAPVITMFMFSYALMNRSIDKWFSAPVMQLQQGTGRMVAMVTYYAGDNARQEALEISQSVAVRDAFARANYSQLMQELKLHQPTLQGGFVVALKGGEAVAAWKLPQSWSTMRVSLPPLERLAQSPATWRFGNAEYMLAAAPAGEGQIVAGIPLPAGFTSTVNETNQAQEQYMALGRQAKRIRGMYMLLLVLLTVMVLFVATWVSLYLAKLVTRPVEALAEATRKISEGHLGHRVEISAADELGALVASFNRMTAELEASRRTIEESADALARSNDELEQRRRHIETILENIPSGVLSLDADKRVTHSNQAFGRMFGQQGRGPLAGSTLQKIFSADVAADLEHLMRRADRMGMTAAQFEIAREKDKLNASVTAASVQHGRQRLGYVIVFEDFSDLLKAQREAAWSEVARRVAHEIKNPLTPIALSAERIRKYLSREVEPDAASLSVIHGCAETISGAVQTVRTLVDDFSSLALFPTARPRPADINEIVEGALGMFNGRLDGIEVRKQLAPTLPLALADPEAIKRALANLIDNAAEATEHSLLREIYITTALVESKDGLEITVADTGHGINREVKEKLFLPYFSTKKRGTGLGLAIVRRIVEDHHGSVRVEENQPSGARFVVELPVAGAMSLAESEHA